MVTSDTGADYLGDRFKRSAVKSSTSSEASSSPSTRMSSETLSTHRILNLAKQCLEGLPGNAPQVTGASGTRILGGIYPGSIKV